MLEPVPVPVQVLGRAKGLAEALVSNLVDPKVTYTAARMLDRARLH